MPAQQRHSSLRASASAASRVQSSMYASSVAFQRPMVQWKTRIAVLRFCSAWHQDRAIPCLRLGRRLKVRYVRDRCAAKIKARHANRRSHSSAASKAHTAAAGFLRCERAQQRHTSTLRRRAAAASPPFPVGHDVRERSQNFQDEMQSMPHRRERRRA